ncbi:MAG: hypothetical protein ACLPHP_13470 [Candidatus Sulfotelmatobacter sp.]
MNYRRTNCTIFRVSHSLLLVAGLLAFAAQFARAADAPQLSGAYRVTHKTDLGPQTRIQLRLHLTNRTARDLHIQRITLSDFSHPDRGGSQACSIVVPAGASVDATQEFTIRRAEYDLWRRGARPRVVLEVQTPSGHNTTEVVRLDRISSGKAD